MPTKDFTVTMYMALLDALKRFDFHFYTFAEFQVRNAEHSQPAITLRHDVDARKQNSLMFAEIQNKEKIKATYYFRMVPQSFDENIIRKIYELGHEVGYHYETMDTSNGNIDKAYDEFCRHLETIRKLVPVTTVCMHGSPLSKYDNRDIWKKYDYKKLGIIAEPYFDLDFNETFYLTDTGRCWNGSKVSVRDKIMTGKILSNSDFLNRNYRATTDIIRDLDLGNFPKNVMMNFHPQRWTNNSLLWWKELILQNFKNQIKKALISN